MTRPIGFFIVAVMLVVSSGCATDDFPTSPPGGGGAVSFSADVQPVFTTNCATSSCHGTFMAEGLDLRAGTSHSQLVNIASMQDTIDRVVPGDAAGSYLVHKLEGTQSSGTQMPQGLPVLSSVDLQNIKDWINDGALDE